jgi:hypothetical protein
MRLESQSCCYKQFLHLSTWSSAKQDPCPKKSHKSGPVLLPGWLRQYPHLGWICYIDIRSIDQSLDLNLSRANEIRISIMLLRVDPPSSHTVLSQIGSMSSKITRIRSCAITKLVSSASSSRVAKLHRYS